MLLDLGHDFEKAHIFESLSQSFPELFSSALGLHMLEDLENRLDQLEDKLRFYADQVVTEEKKLQKEEDIPYGVSRGNPHYKKEILAKLTPILIQLR